MIDKDAIEKRIVVLDEDIAKVKQNIQNLEQQKVEAMGMLNALTGAKQQCMSFLQDLNNDEPEVSDSGDVGNNADSNIPQSKQKSAVMGLI